MVFGSLSFLAAVPSIAGRSLPYAQCAPCDSTRLWGIDRIALGPRRAGLDQASTYTMIGTSLGGAALVMLSRRGEPDAGSARLEDFAVFAEAIQADAAATQWLKVLFHRARPTLYRDSASTSQTVDNGRSFPSGHASFSFASAAAAASILDRRGELGKHKLEVAALFAGAAVTSVLRVSAHRHFPTDVVAGAVLGTAIGWTIPRLHPAR